MKNIVEYFMNKGIVFKKLETIDKKTLKTRKNLAIYLGIDLKGYYNVIISQSKRSRILQKEVNEIDALIYLLQEQQGLEKIKKHYLYDAPICSKAKNRLKELGWKIYDIS